MKTNYVVVAVVITGQYIYILDLLFILAQHYKTDNRL